jgi:hypothetical protein
LNEPGLEAAAGRRYEVVLDGGTLECIFSTAGAFRYIGGAIIRSIMMNNYIKHRFYQINPTFMLGTNEGF